MATSRAALTIASQRFRSTSVALNVFQFDDGIVHQAADPSAVAHRKHVQGLFGKYNTMNVTRIESGMATNPTYAGEVSEQRMTAAASNEPCSACSMRFLIDCRIKSPIEGDPQLHAGDADHFGNGFAQRIDHFHRAGDRPLVDPEIDRPFAVRADDVGLNVRFVGQTPTSRTRTGLPRASIFTTTSLIGSTVLNWVLVNTL